MAKKKFTKMINYKKYDDITEYCSCCDQATTHTVYITMANGEQVPLRDMVPPDKIDAVLAYLRVTGAV